MLVATGMRIGELLALRWSDIELSPPKSRRDDEGWFLWCASALPTQGLEPALESEPNPSPCAGYPRSTQRHAPHHRRSASALTNLATTSTWEVIGKTPMILGVIAIPCRRLRSGGETGL